MIVTVLALVVVGLLTWGLGYIMYRAALSWFEGE